MFAYLCSETNRKALPCLLSVLALCDYCKWLLWIMVTYLYTYTISGAFSIGQAVLLAQLNQREVQKFSQWAFFLPWEPFTSFQRRWVSVHNCSTFMERQWVPHINEIATPLPSLEKDFALCGPFCLTCPLKCQLKTNLRLDIFNKRFS